MEESFFFSIGIDKLGRNNFGKVTQNIYYPIYWALHVSGDKIDLGWG